MQLSELRDWRLRRAEMDVARQAYILAGAQAAESTAAVRVEERTRALHDYDASTLEQARFQPLTKAMLDARRNVVAAMEGECHRSRSELEIARQAKEAEEERLRLLKVTLFDRSRAAEGLRLMIRSEALLLRKRADAAEEERQEEQFSALAFVQSKEGWA